MPASLRFILLISVGAAITAPLAYGVIHEQDVRSARIRAEAMTGGNAERGKRAIQRFGCGACHIIPGIDAADGAVGPSLAGVASRAEIAGIMTNTPDNLVSWIRWPQDVLPGNGMPQQKVSQAEARDIAAYLYTLRIPSH